MAKLGFRSAWRVNGELAETRWRVMESLAAKRAPRPRISVEK